jgi:serine/threonine protein kinase
MAIKPVPAAAQLLPSSPLPSEKKEKKRRPADIESQKMHAKIRKEAEKQVVVWNYKITEASNLPDDSSVLAPVLIQERAVAEIRSPRAELFWEHSGVQRGHPKENRAIAPNSTGRKYLELHSDPLGSGSYGTVMRGIDLTTRSLVAIKRYGSTPFLYQIAVKESEILHEVTRRQVPHCLHLHAAFDQRSLTASTGKERVIVTDLVPSRTVNEMRSYFAGYPQILSLGRQLLEYRAGLDPDIIHSDLAPPNLIYEIDCNHLTVIDHSLSRKAHEISLRRMQASFYRCPEAILNGPVNCSADIWSVGCILFELLTGKPLFKVYDNEENLDLSSNELLQRIALQIGLPTPQFLKKCSDARKFYQVSGSDVFFRNMLHCKDPDWKTDVRIAAVSKGMTEDQALEFIRLLEGMLRYENRLSARELLQSPLFQVGISFHLAPIFSAGDLITICKAGDMDLHLQFPEVVPAPLPVFQLHYDNVTRTCHHIPVRDPHNRYIVYVERQGVPYFGQAWEIQEGQELGFNFSEAQSILQQVIAEEPSGSGAL